MNILVAVSKIHDGNMLNREDTFDRDVIANRSSFLAKNGIDINQTTKVYVVYEGDNYRRYCEVSEQQNGSGMTSENSTPSDALVTRSLNHALFLPIADCVGAVIFDSTKQVLMVSHLGRHSLEQNGAYESIKFLTDNYGCNPAELLIWLSPAPGPDVYPMFAFNNRSIKSVVFQQLRTAGIVDKNITDNSADTSKDAEYYSHSEFLKGNRTEDGRYAVVAMMKS